MRDKISEIQKKLHLKFNDLSYIKLALTHKSYDILNNNERLEFLGDRVIGLILSKKLMELYPKDKEGVLDKKFAGLVNRETCVVIAKELKLNNYLFIGESYKKNFKAEQKILSDALEALIGAIFLDQGFIKTETYILKLWRKFLENSKITEIDAKTKLQEYSLKLYKKLPSYKIKKKSGPHHMPIFEAEVNIPNSKSFQANGLSKKEAQQNAAKKLMENLKK